MNLKNKDVNFKREGKWVDKKSGAERVSKHFCTDVRGTPPTCTSPIHPSTVQVTSDGRWTVNRCTVPH